MPLAGSSEDRLHSPRPNMSEGSESPEVKFIQGEWRQAFEKRDLDLIAKHLHKDYRHTSYPRSLGVPDQTREQWLEHFAGVLGLLTENTVSRINHCLNPLRRG